MSSAVFSDVGKPTSSEGKNRMNRLINTWIER